MDTQIKTPLSATPATTARELTDTQLMRDFYQGNNRAFDELSYRWRRPLLSFFHRMGFNPEDADDLSQNVLLRLYLTRDKAAFQLDRSIAPYLLRTARNLGRTEIGKRSATPPSITLDEVAVSDKNQPLTEALLHDLSQCIEALPEMQQLYVLLCHRHGLGDCSHKEIEEALGRWPSQISELSQRSLTNLRRCLQKKGYNLGE
jgi:RNA polymerase sigma-70 factor (ECF subfamily)